MVPTDPTTREWLSGFGERVRALRLSAGLSQMDLAAAAEMHATYLSGIERGLRNVSLINIHRIAIALNVSVGELFDTAEK